MQQLVLYYRDGCHLCEAFLDELALFQRTHPLEFDLIDVDSSRSLAERYGERIPILAAGDEVICEYFLDSDKLLRYVC